MKLEEFLDAKKELLDRHFVVIGFDTAKPEGEQVQNKLRGKPGGIPWMAILNAKGEVLVTSDGPKGNIGYPLKPDEINYFIKMLEVTKMPDAEREELRTALEAAAAEMGT